MALLAIWSKNPTEVSQFTIDQIVPIAGDGNLKDSSPCSDELRTYLSQAQTTKLEEYVTQCLDAHFTKSGFVLQEVVNELGRRLEYHVTNGRYQGVVGGIGYDGIWTSPEGHSLIVEVKTSDAYRVSLDVIAKYRQRLLEAAKISEPSSILIVVGRQDTGELEAQVRGSRHAWDIRLISADALVKLAKLNESVEGLETGKKIRALLVPREYTKLDDMIDVMFAAAKDAETAADSDVGILGSVEQAPAAETDAKSGWEFTDRATLQAKRESIISAMGKRLGTSLIKKSPALYWNAAHEVRLACTLSKRYVRPGGPRYWYAFHPQWDEFLGEAKQGYLVLGGVDLDFAFALPLETLRSLLPRLNTTVKDDGTHYWHIHLNDAPSGDFLMLLKQGVTTDISAFRFSLK